MKHELRKQSILPYCIKKKVFYALIKVRASIYQGYTIGYHCFVQCISAVLTVFLTFYASCMYSTMLSFFSNDVYTTQ